MGKARILAFFVFSILLAFNVFAASYQLELNQYGSKILEKHNLSLNAEQELTINLPDGFASFESKNAYEINENKLTIEGKEIVFSFVNPSAIETGKKYYLTRKIEAPAGIDVLKLMLALDEGFVFREAYPAPDKIESDGQRIIMRWEFKNLQKGESMPIFVISESVKGISYLWWVIIILVLISLVIWLWLRKQKKTIVKVKAKVKEKRGKAKAEEVEEFLLENEKKVVQELEKEHRKELWQKQIQLRTGLSKVKLSRVLKNLEARGLIKKINFGKTNKIILKK
jgi:hypothetical protein